MGWQVNTEEIDKYGDSYTEHVDAQDSEMLLAQVHTPELDQARRRRAVENLVDEESQLESNTWDLFRGCSITFVPRDLDPYSGDDNSLTLLKMEIQLRGG